MRKKKLSKDERLHRQSVMITVCLVCIIGLVLFCTFQGWIHQRELYVGRLEAKVEAWGAKDTCLNVFGRDLDSEGYCDVSGEEGIYVHYLSCSWGKLKIYSDEDCLSRGDRFNFWMLKCEYDGVVLND